MSKLRVLDLFSGIGGFSLGLERTGGFETVAFCELEPYCQKVLAKHWPGVKCYDDVRSLSADALARDGIAVDVICGGFPCQDISYAGFGAGLAGERSGLWSEYARLIGELRPRYVIVENVAALLGRGLGRVLGDLAAVGYDCEWHCIPAAAVGAPHRRDRIWIIAHPFDPDADFPRLEGRHGGSVPQRAGEWTARASSPSMADAARELHDGTGTTGTERRRQFADGGEAMADADCRPLFGAAIAWPQRHPWLPQSQMGGMVDGLSAEFHGGWITEPDIPRVATGVRNRVDRLRALGNAVVPQIPELIGRAILAREAAG